MSNAAFARFIERVLSPLSAKEAARLESERKAWEAFQEFYELRKAHGETLSMDEAVRRWKNFRLSLALQGYHARRSPPATQRLSEAQKAAWARRRAQASDESTRGSK